MLVILILLLECRIRYLKSLTHIANEHPKNDHIIAPNEGISIGLAIGNYISTGKVPTVYMQNSGIGNAVNPLMSLADKEVYGVPMLLLLVGEASRGKVSHSILSKDSFKKIY